MLRTQLRPVLVHNDRHSIVEGTITSLRQFSVSQKMTDENPGQSSAPSVPGPSTNIPPRPGVRRRPNIPTARPNAQGGSPSRFRPNSARIIDVRSLAASQSSNQANILRGPRLQLPRGGIQTRKPRRPAPAKRPRQQRRSREEFRQQEMDESQLSQIAEVQAIYNELAENERPVPVRYTPQAHDFSSMKDTWPSLPTDVNAQTAGVLEKLSALGGRLPNAYTPPHELGKRLFWGERTHFTSEKEKAQAMKEAEKLARQLADKLSQQRGELVEPRKVEFNPIDAEGQKALVKRLVQGAYSKPEPPQADKPPVIGNIKTNLGKNETYHATGKSSQFLAKFESLFTSSRPAKRS